MDQSHIDDIFKAGLQNHQTPIDNDALWEAINKPDRNKKWLPILKLLSIALLAISLTSALLLIDNSERKTDRLLQKSSIINTEKTISYIANPTTALENSAHKLQENKTESNIESVESKLEKSYSNTHNNNPATLPKSLNKKQTAYNSDKSRMASALDNVSAYKSRSDSFTKREIITSESNTTRSTAHNNHNTSEQNNDNKIVTSQKATAPTRALSSTKLEVIDLNIIPPLYKESHYLDYSREKIANNKKVECYSHSKKQAIISLEGYGLVDLVLPHMTSEPEFDDYLTKRRESQTQREGYRAGLRLKYKLPSNIYIKAGIEYGHMRERFSKETTSTKSEILPDQLLEIIERNDTTIIIYGDALVTTISTKQWRINNSYKTLGLPALIGYDYKGRKCTYGIELGAIYNFNYDFDGYLLNNAFEPEPVKDYFKSSINTSITGGLTLSYHINKHFDLFLQSSFIHNLNDINTSTNLVNQRNTKVGLGTGIRYNIN